MHMRRMRLRWSFVLWFAAAMLTGPSFLRAQTLTLQQSSQIVFSLGSQTAPGGNLVVTVTCTPDVNACPKGITIYADFATTCGLTAADAGGATIPASRVQIDISGSGRKVFTETVPPARNGCGVTLYSGPLPPTQMMTVTGIMSINMQSLHVPVGTYEASLTIRVETF